MASDRQFLFFASLHNIQIYEPTGKGISLGISQDHQIEIFVSNDQDIRRKILNKESIVESIGKIEAEHFSEQNVFVWGQTPHFRENSTSLNLGTKCLMFIQRRLFNFWLIKDHSIHTELGFAVSATPVGNKYQWDFASNSIAASAYTSEGIQTTVALSKQEIERALLLSKVINLDSPIETVSNSVDDSIDLVG